MKDYRDFFRAPAAKDLMDNITLCSHPVHKDKVVGYCRFWGRILFMDDEENVFSKELFENLLHYGCRVISKEIRKKTLVIDGNNLGEQEFLVVETFHQSKFMLFQYQIFLIIIPLKS